jgi:hypothetical protein
MFESDYKIVVDAVHANQNDIHSSRFYFPFLVVLLKCVGIGICIVVIISIVD